MAAFLIISHWKIPHWIKIFKIYALVFDTVLSNCKNRHILNMYSISQPVAGNTNFWWSRTGWIVSSDEYIFTIFTEVIIMINDYEATNPITTDAIPVAPETALNSEVISTLNGLIETCKDGQDGFKEAAEGVERSDLKTVFYEFSQQRAEFTGVLQELVRSLGGDPESTGTMSAALHRGWMDIKSLVTGKDEEAILNECERGEDRAKDAYTSALQTSLPANIADVVGQQSQTILAAHNKIKSLRDTESYKTAAPGTF